MSGLTRRDFLAGAAGAAALGGLTARAAGPAPRRPNILLIETDDHWPGGLGCMGDPVIQTPHLDGLAARGVCFRNNVCQATYCIPSRISLLTGSYPHNNGFHSNHGQGLQEWQWTFPAALRRSGYRCALVGKNHLKLRAESAPDEAAVRKQLDLYGFDEIRPTEGKVWSARGYRSDAYREYLKERGLLDRLTRDYTENRKNALTGIAPSALEAEHHQDAFIVNLAIEWLAGRDARQPFFLWLNFVSPHTPCDAPQPWATMYRPDQMPEPIATAPGALPPALDLEAQRLAKATGPGFAGRFRAAYYGMITWLDVQVGRVLAALDERGLAEDTLIAFCGDQGEMAGDHGLYGKGTFFRSAINSPLIVSWPKGFRKGAYVDQPVELQDLVPTFLEVAGVPEEERRRCFGVGLLPLLSARGRYGRDAAFAEYFEKKMIATPEYKYVHSTGPPARQLFDLRRDPRETRNLAGQRAAGAVERELRDRLLDWLAATWRQPNSKPA